MNKWTNEDYQSILKLNTTPNGNVPTDAEMQDLFRICERTGLSPFLREIMLRFQGGKFQVFIQRDGDRKIAKQNSLFNGHTFDAVYEGDEWELVDGKVNFKPAIKSREKTEKPLFGYCEVHIKGCVIPTVTRAFSSEYNTGYANWKTKPAAMIAKVAEAQALRAAFPDDFSGTWNEAEVFEQVEKAAPKAKSNDLVVLQTLIDEGWLDGTKLFNECKTSSVAGMQPDEVIRAIEIGLARKEQANR